MGIISCIIDWIIEHATVLATVVTALATWAIACFTITLAKTNKGQLFHARRTERAYVQISHNQPGAIVDAKAGTVECSVNIRNYGRTPATITDVFLKLVFDTLPTEPPYVRPFTHQRTRVFLVAGNSFNHSNIFAADNYWLMEADLDERKLWLIGYVDYIDAFGNRHRGGYMRRYVPQGGDNTLHFDPTPGYNFDRVRERDEGDDWKENA